MVMGWNDLDCVERVKIGGLSWVWWLVVGWWWWLRFLSNFTVTCTRMSTSIVRERVLVRSRFRTRLCTRFRTRFRTHSLECVPVLHLSDPSHRGF